MKFQKLDSLSLSLSPEIHGSNSKNSQKLESLNGRRGTINIITRVTTRRVQIHGSNEFSFVVEEEEEEEGIKLK